MIFPDRIEEEDRFAVKLNFGNRQRIPAVYEVAGGLPNPIIG
jgi:hypothetical protein